MDLNWEIRAATTKDAPGLKHCMESAYTAYQQRMGGSRLPPMDADYLSEIENYPTWIAVSGKTVLGGLIMVFDTDRASIANIAVDPKFQGQGIGGKLIKFAESRAREQGASELNLVTHALLSENISLYLYLGWVETGRDETRIFMKKVLDLQSQASK